MSKSVANRSRIVQTEQLEFTKKDHALQKLAEAQRLLREAVKEVSIECTKTATADFTKTLDKTQVARQRLDVAFSQIIPSASKLHSSRAHYTIVFGVSIESDLLETDNLFEKLALYAGVTPDEGEPPKEMEMVLDYIHYLMRCFIKRLHAELAEHIAQYPPLYRYLNGLQAERDAATFANW